MCLPAVTGIIQGVSLVSGIASGINQYNKTSAAARYQAQAALVNMKNARNLAYQERQKEAQKEDSCHHNNKALFKIGSAKVFF